MNPIWYRHEFLFLFASTLAVSATGSMTVVSTGWLVLEMTGSPLSLGIVWATRAAPHLLWGMLAGALADKLDRRRLLLWISIVLAGAAFLFGSLIMNGLIQLWHVFLFIFVTSSLKTFDMTARQAMVVDVVGRDHMMRSIALNSVGLRMMGLIGGAVAGVLISILGLASPFYVMAACYGIGLISLWLVRTESARRNQNALNQPSLWTHYREGFTIIAQNRVVTILVVLAILCEIFGFSYQVLLPLFARDILEVRALGLGAFTAAQSMGGLIATLALTAGSQYQAKGRLLLILYLSFGVVLLLFAQSSVYIFSLIIICLTGGVAAAFDAMQHIMLQLNVGEQQRGRAMGIWQVSIGFGPIGHILLGFIATTIGPIMALTINGILIIVSFFVITQITQFRKITGSL
jgi:MFS family permease